jgi:hypothetical protein
LYNAALSKINFSKSVKAIPLLVETKPGLFIAIITLVAGYFRQTTYFTKEELIKIKSNLMLL